MGDDSELVFLSMLEAEKSINSLLIFVLNPDNKNILIQFRMFSKGTNLSIMLGLGLISLYSTTIFAVHKNVVLARRMIVFDLAISALYLPVCWLHFNFTIFPSGITYFAILSSIPESISLAPAILLGLFILYLSLLFGTMTYLHFTDT